MERTIILIGGTPTVGKSTIASLLSKRLEVPWISTDQTRDIMKVVADETKYPDLYNDDGYNAETFLTTFSAEEIADLEIKQSIAAWPGNKKLIEGDYTWRDGFIFEGVGILPELVSTIKKDIDVRPVFLIDQNIDRMREVVFNRGLWDMAHTYSDDLKEIEVEWATIFSNKIEQSARQYNYPVVKIEKDGDKDIKAVLESLNL